jgi:hypothetical protein
MIRRHETTIIMGEDADARSVTVREITPGQALLFHKAVLAGPAGADAGVALDSAAAVADLLVGDTDVKLQLLASCTSLGDEVYELGAAAFMRLWRGFEEVNTPFLDELAQKLRQGAQTLAAAERAPSEAPDSTRPDSARP